MIFDLEIPITKVHIEARAEKLKYRKELKFSARNENCKALIASVGGFPENDEIVNLVSDGTSDTGGFFTALLDDFGGIDEMWLSTWTISMQNVNRILEAYDGGLIKELNFLINDGLLKTNSTKAIWGAINEQFRKRGIKFKAVNSHAKIFCIKIGDRYITISGSGNWSENPRIENYFLIGGEQTFSFNKKWMSEQLNY
jgi:hypothetical protein